MKINYYYNKLIKVTINILNLFIIVMIIVIKFYNYIKVINLWLKPLKIIISYMKY